MDMDWHSLLTTLPLLGVTGFWRGVRIGGEVLGDVGGTKKNKDLTKKFDEAKKTGDRIEMEKVARQMNERRLQANREKTAGLTEIASTLPKATTLDVAEQVAPPALRARIDKGRQVATAIKTRRLPKATADAAGAATARRVAPIVTTAATGALLSAGVSSPAAAIAAPIIAAETAKITASEVSRALSGVGEPPRLRAPSVKAPKPKAKTAPKKTKASVPKTPTAAERRAVQAQLSKINRGD